ncbi:hypothetical protein ACFOQM_09210 [Paenibacillus sp. GCM10012307]|uniref:Uncharacterized protein n=1 Tax=Paenibacillus roseus TaxID=2798579 RepID=A0A934J644_9BACL|nr:hypothetical protein [Paenibacillus roseus]MBJ6361461.1 hypothetical protein [Paenibacillus roseus]
MKSQDYILWTLIVIVFSMLHIHALRRSTGKTKGVFWLLAGAAWLLGLLLFHNPELPGPNDLTKKLFHPLGRWLLS